LRRRRLPGSGHARAIGAARRTQSDRFPVRQITTLELAGTAGAQIRTLVARIDAIAAAHPEAAAYQPGLVL